MLATRGQHLKKEAGHLWANKVSLEAKAKWPYSRLVLRRKQRSQGNSFPFKILEPRSWHPQTPFAKHSLQRLLATLVGEMEWTEDTAPASPIGQTHCIDACVTGRRRNCKGCGRWGGGLAPTQFPRITGERFSEQLSSRKHGTGKAFNRGCEAR